MRYIISIIAVLLCLNIQAQTTVRSDGVLYEAFEAYRHMTHDSLNVNVAKNLDFYVKDFGRGGRFHISVDTVEASYVKVNSYVLGSLDYINWYAATADTLSIAGAAGGAGHKLVLPYWNYYRVVVNSVDSTQRNHVRVRFLIDKN